VTGGEWAGAACFAIIVIAVGLFAHWGSKDIEKWWRE